MYILTELEKQHFRKEAVKRRLFSTSTSQEKCKSRKTMNTVCTVEIYLPCKKGRAVWPCLFYLVASTSNDTKVS
jgi:hypothetical protein